MAYSPRVTSNIENHKITTSYQNLNGIDIQDSLNNQILINANSFHHILMSILTRFFFLQKYKQHFHDPKFWIFFIKMDFFLNFKTILLKGGGGRKDGLDSY